ncbi:hydrolase [Glutamicibacter sp. V16R2B1]|uniref:hydrolase n=1 Tax=Glutamicibacter sp. V16R2B1 TaxID=2036207 RepID=UPI0014854CD2|nr:hydrolase [Glutamicibacter sp. V16R2B1]
MEFEPSRTLPTHCPICEDERQYIPGGTQRWTCSETLEREGHQIQVRELEEGLTALRAPEVGIGQSALLIRSEDGNLLFDVPGMISSHAVEVIRELGGIAAIVASHPHMYGVQVQYSQAFDDAPIYVAEADKQWVQRSSDAIRYWSESFEVLPGIWLHQVGGHFPGSTVAEWAAGARGGGALLAGDAVFPVADGNVTFLRSYPNRIPLSAAVVRRMAAQLDSLRFDRLYNNFAACVPSDAHRVVQFSAERYARWVGGDYDELT